MTIQEALVKYHKIEIELLLSAALKKPREFLYLNQQVSLSANQQISLQKMIKRRQAGEPLAYILGYKDFMGLRFIVNQDVLIPRPETEWLVDKIVSSIKYQVSRGTLIRILDLGTGSGCIAISLAHYLKKDTNVKKFKLIATDISLKALKVAKANAQNHKVKIRFIQSDILKNIRMSFDVIVANLPYVPLKMLRRFLLHRAAVKADEPFAGLKYEPKFALTDGTSIWLIYKRFFDEVRGHLNPGGVIFLEIDPSSRRFLKEYQQKYLPNAKVKFYKDMNNFWRYMEIKIPA